MRLVDADVLKAKAFGKRGGLIHMSDIDAMPTVDAVPVVRCKDCRFSDWYTAVNGKRYCYCMEHDSSSHEDNDFCSYGERGGEHEAD